MTRTGCQRRNTLQAMAMRDPEGHKLSGKLSTLAKRTNMLIRCASFAFALTHGRRTNPHPSQCIRTPAVFSVPPRILCFISQDISNLRQVQIKIAGSSTAGPLIHLSLSAILGLPVCHLFIAFGAVYTLPFVQAVASIQSTCIPLARPPVPPGFIAKEQRVKLIPPTPSHLPPPQSCPRQAQVIRRTSSSG